MMKNKKGFQMTASLLVKILVALVLLAIILIFIAKAGGYLTNVNIPGF